VIERVRSFHSSRQSLSNADTALGSGSGGSSGARALRQYSPAQQTIHEEPGAESVTRANTGTDQATTMRRHPQPAMASIFKYVCLF